VSITTDLASLISAHGEVCSIQVYLIDSGC